MGKKLTLVRQAVRQGLQKDDAEIQASHRLLPVYLTNVIEKKKKHYQDSIVS